MAIDSLKSNLAQEKKIIAEVYGLLRDLKYARLKKQGSEEKILRQSIISLISQLEILNDSIPDLLKDISTVKKLPKIDIEKKQEFAKFSSAGGNQEVTIRKSDRDLFLKQLKINEHALKKLKQEKKQEKEITGFKKPNFYAKLSNKFFSEFAISLLNKGSFRKLNLDLKKANFSITTSTYVAVMFFSLFLCFFLSLIVFSFLLFFEFTALPFIVPVEEEILDRALKIFWVIFVIPLAMLFALYFYPGSERKSISKKIDQELPFVAVHMSAISSSGIEPSNIFKIIALSKEYKYTRKEAKKLVNQINLYGYDIVTALRNVSLTTSSKKLSELFTGLATTISSGGSLTDFLDKRAESLLFEYKLEREKYTRIAETFMDIYISIVIAAPMILMLLLIMISISGISLGLSIGAFTLIIVSVIALINILFIMFLNLKQPGY